MSTAILIYEVLITSGFLLNDETGHILECKHFLLAHILMIPESKRTACASHRTALCAVLVPIVVQLASVRPVRACASQLFLTRRGAVFSCRLLTEAVVPAGSSFVSET